MAVVTISHYNGCNDTFNDEGSINNDDESITNFNKNNIIIEIFYDMIIDI